MEINAETKRRLHEYTITQMLNILKFILAVNEITDSGTNTFDEVCIDKRNEFILTMSEYVPNFNCLWDIIFDMLDKDDEDSFTPILSAYCRSNKIKTKHDIYVKMSDELEKWVDTIDRFEDRVIIAIGMSQKNQLCEIFSIYCRNYKNDVTITQFYRRALDILKKNNFENIDPDSYKIKPYTPIRTKYDDPLQQVFYKYIILDINYEKKMKLSIQAICMLLSQNIKYRFDIDIPIYPSDKNNDLIIEYVDYVESKIPQYPDKIKGHLSILASIDWFIEDESENLVKMAELSKYNLRNLPIEPIINGYYGATPLDDIPLEDIPEYYARLTYSYNNTKAARR